MTSQHNLSQDKKVNCVVLAEGSSLVLTGVAGVVNAIEDPVSPVSGESASSVDGMHFIGSAFYC